MICIHSLVQPSKMIWMEEKRSHEKQMSIEQFLEKQKSFPSETNDRISLIW